MIRKFTPEGVDDINYMDYEKKDFMQSIVRHVLKTYGYKQIQTPTFEYYDVFRDIDTTIDNDQMYKMIDANGKILVLRPDATIPIARMAAVSKNTSGNYKKYMYCTNVFRSADFRAGGKREFVQAGVEYLGNESSEADAEVIAAAVKVFQAAGFQQIKVDLGNANYFNGLMEEIKIEDSEKNIMRNLMENKNFAELRKLLDKTGIAESVKKVLLELPFLYGTFEKTVEKAMQLALNDKMKQAAENMTEIYELLQIYQCADLVGADMGFVNHLDYYSGMIFKVYVGNLGQPAASGGRYDGLVEKFGRKIAATGFGINIDAMYDLAIQEHLLEEYTDWADYVVICKNERLQEAIFKAEELRKKGYTVVLGAGQDPKDIKAFEIIEIQ